MASHVGSIVTVVLLLTQHVWMKPTQVSKDIVQGNNLEKELEAEAQNPTFVEQTDSQHGEDESVGEWGDVVDGIDVGNVIRDVLLTLRDHPEIVRKLIEDEEKSLAEKVLSSERDMALETPEDDELLLSDQILPRDFQLPSPQLHQASKRVVKKMGSYKYVTEKQKREQENPEETIDMTYPVEGGSDEMDLKQQNDDDSGDTVQSKDIKTGHLEEGGSAKQVYSGTDGVKRRYSSQIDNEEDDSDESTSSNKPSNTESSESDESKEQIWKAYKDRKQKENKEQHKGNQQKHDNGQKLSKAEYWKQYGKDKNYRKHRKDVQNDSEEDNSNAHVWRKYIKNKEENSKETSEDVSDSNDVDSHELDNSSHNDHDGRGTDKKDIDENELYQLTKQKNVVM